MAKHRSPIAPALLAGLLTFAAGELVAQTPVTAPPVASPTITRIDPLAPVTSVVRGRTYINHGLVGVGRVPAALKDKFGETHGSFSAFAIKPGSWQRLANGAYTATLYTQPDRGYNVAGTTNYVPRFNIFDISFVPTAGGSQDNVRLTLRDTIKFTEADGTPFTSLDPTSTGTGTRAGFPALPQAFNGRLSLDAEGIIVNPDGTLWVSEEYGPYIFKFSAAGVLQSAVRPPAAVIPQRNGADSFASNNPGPGQPAPSPANPVTGRQNNQGMEGLSISPDGRTMFALLQSAARQDGGTGGTGPRQNTRLFVYDLTSGTPSLKAEYVVQLPTFANGTATVVAAQSEVLAVSNTQLLVLARDGNGRGLANPQSNYRRILIYDITGATNLVGTAYDTAGTPIAPGGVLAAGITPASRHELIDLNDSAQLAKFGLRNGAPDDANNLSEKWEALALVPALDLDRPDDWFLLVGNDNDFITSNGFQDGGAYDAGFDNDNMVLVYRLTLPSRLLNLSTRAAVTAGGNPIAGFVVNGARPKAMLIRGVGPSLAAFGVTGAVSNPALTVFNAAGAVVAANDTWGSAPNLADLTAATARAGAFALTTGSEDAALLLTLDPGAYTVQLSGTAGATGTGLIEIYEVP